MALIIWAAGWSHAQAPVMSDDFAAMMAWLSQEMAHGLAFNAGSTFDPPYEVKGYRLAPDLSIGVGSMPLDKTKFPVPTTSGLKDANVQAIFPAKVLFPNLTMHLRAALVGRHDFSIRFTDMTTPPNYKISPTATAKGQSNSIGFGVRRHFLGGPETPLISVGANYNHVFGTFKFKTKFNVNTGVGFSADNDIFGTLQWNVKSFGMNAVVSQRFGNWTPFGGLGYSYTTGSVRARLELLSHTFLISPAIGESSRKPEASSARYILGTQWDRSWVHFFTNGEIKAAGVHKGESWIVHAGFLLPFRIGFSRKAVKKTSHPQAELPSSADEEAEEPAPVRRAPSKRSEVIKTGDPEEKTTEMIFLQ